MFHLWHFTIILNTILLSPAIRKTIAASPACNAGGVTGAGIGSLDRSSYACCHPHRWGRLVLLFNFLCIRGIQYFLGQKTPSHSQAYCFLIGWINWTRWEELPRRYTLNLSYHENKIISTIKTTGQKSLHRLLPLRQSCPRSTLRVVRWGGVCKPFTGESAVGRLKSVYRSTAQIYLSQAAAQARCMRSLSGPGSRCQI